MNAKEAKEIADRALAVNKAQELEETKQYIEKEIRRLSEEGRYYLCVDLMAKYGRSLDLANTLSDWLIKKGFDTYVSHDYGTFLGVRWHELKNS